MSKPAIYDIIYEVFDVKGKVPFLTYDELTI